MSRRTNIHAALKRRVLARNKSRCHYCGASIGGRDLQIEHKTPVSRGGLDDEGNLVPSCKPCNYRKGTRDAGEFEAFKRSMVSVERIARKLGVKPEAVKAACWVANIKLTPSRSFHLIEPTDVLKVKQIFHDA